MASSKNTKMVSVIIPAYNEALTLTAVIAAAQKHPLVDEIIVVDDGSEDQTAEQAKQAGAFVIRNRQNSGKAAAMERGVHQAKNDIVCFLDADLCGFEAEMLSAILKPVLSGEYDMFVGICARKSDFANEFLEKTPLLGGQRALTKKTWAKVPEKYKENFQIEIALNYFAKKNGKRLGCKVVPGLSQRYKEQKRGVILGLWQRLGMIRDLILIFCRLYIVHTLKTNFLSGSRS